jgi:hypothetical protein
LTLADLVIPTPGIHIVAWIALISGISWFILFASIVRKDSRAARESNDKLSASTSYRLVCFLCLMTCVVLSLIVDLGVVSSG